MLISHRLNLNSCWPHILWPHFMLSTCLLISSDVNSTDVNCRASQRSFAFLFCCYFLGSQEGCQPVEQRNQQRGIQRGRRTIWGMKSELNALHIAATVLPVFSLANHRSILMLHSENSLLALSLPAQASHWELFIFYPNILLYSV